MTKIIKIKDKIDLSKMLSFLSRDVNDLSISGYSLFLENFGSEFEHHINFTFDKKGDITNVKKNLDDLLNSLDLDISNKTYENFDNGNVNEYDNWYVIKNEYIVIALKVSYENTVTIIYNDNASSVLVEKLKKCIKDTPRYKPASSISIISYNRDFVLNDYEISVEESDKFNFEDCYNDDFLPVADHIVDSLNKNNSKGIVLMHGSFGSGKTFFLRRLIKNINGKKIIYMPPDIATMISSPQFIKFLMANPNSVLIIEDAENILMAREGTGNPHVSNLLNVSDGILSDALHMQIVCTFNCPKSDIDKALLRPGRLIAEYEFHKLSEAKTKNLVHKLYGDDVIIPKASVMTVAEIFNMLDDIPQSEVKKKVIGFVP